MIDSTGVAVVVPAVAGYLLGSIPTAVIIGRRRHVDLRVVGDRNPGWWNAKEELGRRAALPVLVGDVAKGAAGAAIGRLLARPWWLGYVGGAAAMIGHAWPLFARFRGGRSVATLGGAAACWRRAGRSRRIAASPSGGPPLRQRRPIAGFGYPVAQVLIDARAHAPPRAGSCRSSGCGSAGRHRPPAGASPRSGPARPGRDGPHPDDAATATRSAVGDSQYGRPARS